MNENRLLIVKRLKEQVAKERELTAGILADLREVEDQKIFAEMGYSSMFEFATKELSYTEGAAQRRILAMRLIKQIPEVEEKIVRGSLSLSAAASVQSFFKKESVSTEKKMEILMAVENTSSRECERKLLEFSSTPTQLPKETEKLVGSGSTQISFVANRGLMEELESIRNLLGHKNDSMSYATLFENMAKLTLIQLNKKRHVASPTPESKHADAATDRSISPSRYIPSKTRREIWLRDDGQCTFKNEEGHRCNSKFALEIEHLIPWSVGGTNTLENLALLCRTHNRWRAVKFFGEKKINQYA